MLKAFSIIISGRSKFIFVNSILWRSVRIFPRCVCETFMLNNVAFNLFGSEEKNDDIIIYLSGKYILNDPKP